MRHSAVKVDGTTLLVFYSIVGDSPERIVLSTIDLTRPWMAWKATEPIVVLEPEMDWEGSSLPLKPSVRGGARSPVRELRDPAVFVEAGRTYLLYSVAGRVPVPPATGGDRGRPVRRWCQRRAGERKACRAPRPVPGQEGGQAHGGPRDGVRYPHGP